jgi:hypothetical protein
MPLRASVRSREVRIHPEVSRVGSGHDPSRSVLIFGATTSAPSVGLLHFDSSLW